MFIISKIFMISNVFKSSKNVHDFTKLRAIVHLNGAAKCGHDHWRLLFFSCNTWAFLLVYSTNRVPKICIQGPLSLMLTKSTYTAQNRHSNHINGRKNTTTFDPIKHMLAQPPSADRWAKSNNSFLHHWPKLSHVKFKTNNSYAILEWRRGGHTKTRRQTDYIQCYQFCYRR